MGKVIKYLIVVLIILFITVIVLWGFIPKILSSQLTKKMGVPVHISSLQIFPSRISIENTSIGSPPKSVLPKSLLVEETKIYASIFEYFKDDIVIDTITMNDIYLGIELDKQGSSNSNWSYIMGNLSKGKASDKGEEKTKVLIKKVILTNLDIELAYRDQKGKIQKLKPIKRLELTNITSEGGIPSAQITHIILQEALRQIFSLEGLQNLIKNVISPDGGFLDSLKGIFGEEAA